MIDSYCFNPLCMSPFDRVFAKGEHKACMKWTLSASQILTLRSGQIKKVSAQREVLRMKARGLQEIIYYQQRKVSIEAQLTNIFDGLRDDLVGMIETSKRSVLLKFEEEAKSFDKIIQAALQVGAFENRKFASYQIESSLKSLSDIFDTSFRDLLFYDMEVVRKTKLQIKKNIEQLADSMVKEDQAEGQRQFLTQRDLEGMRQHLNRQLNQVRLLQQVLGWEQKHFIRETKEGSFQSRCLFCSFQITFQEKPHNLKTTTRPILENLIQHLMERHEDVVAVEYSFRISKRAIVEMRLEEIIYTMEKHNYKELIVCDSTGSKMVREERGPATLFIQFIPQSRSRNTLQNKYVVVNSCEEAAYYLVILLHEVGGRVGKPVKLRNFKKQYYHLLSRIVSVKQMANIELQEKKQNLK